MAIASKKIKIRVRVSKRIRKRKRKDQEQTEGKGRPLRPFGLWKTAGTVEKYVEKPGHLWKTGKEARTT